MPGPYVTSAGLTIPTVETLKTDLANDQRALVDSLIDVDAEEVLGQINGIFASALREAYEVVEVAYNAFDPDAVEDSRVDVLMAITGSVRAPATKSTFTGTRKLTIDLDATSTIPIGTIFEVDGTPSIRFLTTEEIVSTTAGPYLVEAEAENAGRVVAVAHSVTVITTPVVGLNSVDNDFDAIVGTEVDTDEEALVRRENELDALGSGTVDAIRAHLLDYELDGDKPILECIVYSNDNDTINVIGMPGHSLEAVIFDGLGADAVNGDVAQIIWDNKPAGTATYGSSSSTAQDASGVGHSVAFSRVDLVGVDVDVTINKDTATYAGDAAVYAAWSEFATGVALGSDEVKFSKAIQAILAVPGVLGVETIRLRRHAGSYLSAFTDLELNAREKSYAETDVAYCTIAYA